MSSYPLLRSVFFLLVLALSGMAMATTARAAVHCADNASQLRGILAIVGVIASNHASTRCPCDADIGVRSRQPWPARERR